MCQFLSVVSNGDGKPLYFDAKLRKKLKGKYEPDSHTSIADYFGFKGAEEDTLNKYEYNPITKVFQIDQKNNPKDDSAEIKSFCEKLDFKLIVPELNIHPIVNPFKDFSVTEVTNQDLKLLKEWASVRASVWDSVGASVRDSVRAYTATFFDIKYKYDFSSAQKLWNKGLVPSFDGTEWRLHGKEGKIIWQGKIGDIY
jgi:hypothetical protein